MSMWSLVVHLWLFPMIEDDDIFIEVDAIKCVVSDSNESYLCFLSIDNTTVVSTT